MSKKRSNQLIELSFSFVILSSFIGIKETLTIAKQMFSMFNLILVSFYDITILNVMFKYLVTFPIVGLFLMMLGSSKGKEGHWIGKFLYFIIGYVIGVILDVISNQIF